MQLYAINKIDKQVFCYKSENRVKLYAANSTDNKQKKMKGQKSYF